MKVNGKMGKKNGNGTTFNLRGYIIYKGRWKNDKKDGYGILYDEFTN